MTPSTSIVDGTDKQCYSVRSRGSVKNGVGTLYTISRSKAADVKEEPIFAVVS